jgi:hypothetical protein
LTALWKRLPFIVVGVLGIWLWQGGGGFVAVEHSLVWKVPGAYGSVRRVEFQLWDGEQLLIRGEQETPRGLNLDPERKLSIKRGSYRSELLVWREGRSDPEVQRSTVQVGSETVTVIR